MQITNMLLTWIQRQEANSRRATWAWRTPPQKTTVSTTLASEPLKSTRIIRSFRDGKSKLLLKNAAITWDAHLGDDGGAWLHLELAGSEWCRKRVRLGFVPPKVSCGALVLGVTVLVGSFALGFRVNLDECVMDECWQWLLHYLYTFQF